MYLDLVFFFLDHYCLNDLITARLTSGTTAEKFVKDVPELNVEGSVDNGVDGAVNVTKPRDHANQCWSNITRLAQCLSHMNHEERSPAGQKNT